MARDKTKTIKQRRIDVYLPSLHVKEAWAEAAKDRGQSVSEMVFMAVQRALHEDSGDTEARAAALGKQVEALEHELDEQRRKVRTLEILNQRMENDLERYRAQAFLGEPPQGQVNRNLMSLLSEARDRAGRPRPLTDQEIRRRMRIEPTDELRNRELSAQLDFMENFGFIKHTQKGWVWNGR